MIDQKLLTELKEYVKRHLDGAGSFIYEIPIRQEMEVHSRSIKADELEEFIKYNRKPTFTQMLFSLIDNRDATDSDIYKRAGMDRRHFSKIRSNPDYRPGKNTVIALAIALKLNQEETEELLGSAGYSLSDSDIFDLVIRFCLNKEIYNIHEVNQALDTFKLKLLG